MSKYSYVDDGSREYHMVECEDLFYSFILQEETWFCQIRMFASNVSSYDFTELKQMDKN